MYSQFSQRALFSKTFLRYGVDMWRYWLKASLIVTLFYSTFNCVQLWAITFLTVLSTDNSTPQRDSNLWNCASCQVIFHIILPSITRTMFVGEKQLYTKLPRWALFHFKAAESKRALICLFVLILFLVPSLFCFGFYLFFILNKIKSLQFGR